MKKLLLLSVLIISVALPSYSAFWNRNKNTNQQQSAQTQQQAQQTQTQTQTQQQSTNEATYPQDVDGAPISQDEYIDDTDVEEAYRKMPVPKHRYIHNIDPGEYQDTMYTTWSPYPLFRLTAPLYFKSIAIQPGYYLLTPREHEGKWYILFKEAGRIKYIIPCYKRDMVPFGFYENNLPKVKLTRPQKIREEALKWIGKHKNSAKRKPTPDTFLDANDLDNNFISLIVYWGNYRYYFVLRSIQL
jgi:type II secretory pathway pseudopilin PulG